MTTHPLTIAAMAALLLSVPAGTQAQQRMAGSGPRTTVPDSAGQYRDGHWGVRQVRGRHRGGRHGFGYPGFIIVEREPVVIVEREVVVREVAAPAPPPPPPAPRKPYIVGHRYASLPGGCMKMIEGAASYYYCGGGEWYQPVGSQYRAVARP